MKTGIVLGESITQYHQTDAFSFSRLKVFRRLPALYHAIYVAKSVQPKPPTAALEIGKALDCLLLDGVEEYQKQVVIHPGTYGPEDKPWSWNAKECKAWGEKHSTLTILSPKEADLVEEMAEACYAHPIAAALLENGSPGVTWRADFGFAHGQSRSDWYCPEGCTLPDGTDTGPYWIELKTCASLNSADFINFREEYANREYFLQIAFYAEMMKEVLQPLGRPAPRPLFLVVDKGLIPYAQVFDPLVTERGKEQFELARRRIIQDVEYLARCYSTGNWPGLPQTIQSLELPTWTAKRLEEELS